MLPLKRKLEEPLDLVLRKQEKNDEKSRSPPAAGSPETEKKRPRRDGPVNNTDNKVWVPPTVNTNSSGSKVWVPPKGPPAMDLSLDTSDFDKADEKSARPPEKKDIKPAAEATTEKPPPTAKEILDPLEAAVAAMQKK